ncbi:UNVERIFIED_CONTAM: membrane-associated protease RseP (regulator of RpoE activity) [Jeotgalibacillus campisalis]
MGVAASLMYLGRLLAQSQGVGMADYDAGIFVASTTVGLLGVVGIHEMGHVCAYRALGLGWHRIVLGWTPSVGSDDQKKVWQQLIISASGPLVEIALGGLVLGLLTFEWSPLGFVTAFALANGTMGLLVPISRNCDAAKLYRAIWGCLRGRANFAWA